MSNMDDFKLTTLMATKRIKTECKELLQKKPIKNLELKTIKDNNYGLISFSLNDNQYCFKMNSNYPFDAPKLFINNLSHHDYLDLKTERFRKTFKYLFDMDCLCCNFELCQNIWTIGYRMNYIIDRLNDMRQIKLDVARKILADQIKDKYLISDIDLDSWLFGHKL